MRYITNPKINVATRNIENYILKNLSRKMVQNSFMQQNYSSHKANGKRKFRPYFWSEQLSNTYIEILKSYGYFIESHVSRFGDMFEEKFPGL